MMSAHATYGYLEFPGADAVRIYADPIEVVTAHTVEEVLPALKRVESRVGTGLHAAGFVGYEAAPAFDPSFQTHSPGPLPLLWFGLYEHWHAALPAHQAPLTDRDMPTWTSHVSRSEYKDALARIRHQIGAGNTYQVNYTYPTTAHFDLDGYTWFNDRIHAQRGAYSAYLNVGDHQIISLSPELFFSLGDSVLTSRPMKGTRPRGFSASQDQALAAALRCSPKERAENLMIVDMLRNDMGRVCTTGSIQVPELFSIEQYPTVWQMTSTITGDCHASVPEIFQALFPCASVTGAPKIETMKIIRQLEQVPRGAYCGAIGWWSPDRQARFNVAIRTAVVETESARATYSVGSGITWDSVDDQEFEECQTKTAVLHHHMPEFELLTSLRLDDDGYFLLPYHLDRLARSAAHFDFQFDREVVSETLEAYRAEVDELPAKIRLCVNRLGTLTLTHSTLPEGEPWKVGLSSVFMDTEQPWIYHKTTHRDCYDTARATRPDCMDVILTDSEGRLTEATYANVVLEIEGRKLTPPLENGLLDGVFRRHLIETGVLEEQTLRVDDLARADQIFLINSVRKWIPVAWQPLEEKASLGV